jgi:molecular chaperone GrpE
MDEKAGSHKPLRSTSNKLRDLYSTYIKNEEVNLKPDDKPHIYAYSEADNIKEDTINVEIESKNDGQPTEEPLEAEMVLQLVDKFDKIVKERDEAKDQLKRMAAELENFRRRSLKEKQEMIDYANERLLFKLLQLLDDISAAIDARRQSSDIESLLKGIEMINAKTLKIFEEAGVVRMENPVGKPFNVELQEAMMHIPSELPEEHVVQEILPGYMIYNKVLRHAKVITSAGMPDLDSIPE